MANQLILNALGPLAPLYEDPAVTEIMVDSPQTVIVEREGKLEDVAIRFDPPEILRKLVDAVLALGGITLKPG